MRRRADSAPLATELTHHRQPDLLTLDRERALADWHENRNYEPLRPECAGGGDRRRPPSGSNVGAAAGGEPPESVRGRGKDRRESGGVGGPRIRADAGAGDASPCDRKVVPDGTGRSVPLAPAGGLGVPALLTTGEVAQLLRVHRNTVDREREAGRLACVRIGRRVFYTAKMLREYLAGEARTPKSRQQEDY